ncbi:MAG: uncharacterized protein KVP18_001427 [Porospora cf. gigantea A]|uniref:uncharacterized protein n=1 Tax=Porospora cf. gigantea A TaxID=2853593 RepID=UPI00355949F0|nr:MAG: hypothetical protein KVP18_001427 [Porospora cf. gigantea A]
MFEYFPAAWPSTDLAIQSGDVACLCDEFQGTGVKCAYIATLHDRPSTTDVALGISECEFCWGYPEKGIPVNRYYPRDGDVWWHLRDQVLMLRRQCGLDEFGEEEMQTARSPRASADPMVSVPLCYPSENSLAMSMDYTPVHPFSVTSSYAPSYDSHSRAAGAPESSYSQ